jgi:hypothetical protein
MRGQFLSKLRSWRERVIRQWFNAVGLRVRQRKHEKAARALWVLVDKRRLGIDIAHRSCASANTEETECELTPIHCTPTNPPAR